MIAQLLINNEGQKSLQIGQELTKKQSVEKKVWVYEWKREHLRAASIWGRQKVILSQTTLTKNKSHTNLQIITK